MAEQKNEFGLWIKVEADATSFQTTMAGLTAEVLGFLSVAEQLGNVTIGVAGGAKDVQNGVRQVNNLRASWWQTNKLVGEYNRQLRYGTAAESARFSAEKAREQAASSKQRYYGTLASQSVESHDAWMQQSQIDSVTQALDGLMRQYQVVGQVADGVADTLGAGAKRVFDDFMGIQDALQLVRRTTVEVGEDASKMNGELLGVAQNVAVGVKEISGIAEAGGAANVPKEMMGEFTEAVAVFADSTEVSADQASLNIARIYNLVKGQNPDTTYGKLANSMFAVGVNAASTTEEILETTTRLAPLASSFKIADSQIIALGSTLASLGISSERAGTSMIRSFANLSKHVAQNGQELRLMADMSGMSAERFAAYWNDAPVDAFMTLMESMQGATYGGKNFAVTMSKLRANGSRDGQTWMALSNNVSEYERQLGIASGSLVENGEMFERYGEYVETVQSQLEIINNNFETLHYTMLQGLPVEPFMAVAEGMRMLNGLMEENPGLRFFGGLTTGIMGVVAAGARLLSFYVQQRAATAQMMTAQILASQTEQTMSAATLKGVAADVRKQQSLRAKLLALAGYDTELVKGIALQQEANAAEYAGAASGRAAAGGAKAAAAGVSALSVALKGIGAMAGIGAALYALNGIMKNVESIERSQKATFEAAGNSVIDFTQAIERDAKAAEDGAVAVYGDGRLQGGRTGGQGFCVLAHRGLHGADRHDGRDGQEREVRVPCSSRGVSNFRRVEKSCSQAGFLQHCKMT